MDKSVRKPIFGFDLTMKNGDQIKFDQQKVDIFKQGTLNKSISVVDLSVSVPYYLRGVDFTMQMQDLIGERKTLATISEAMITRNLINEVLKK